MEIDCQIDIIEHMGEGKSTLEVQIETWCSI